MGNKREPSAQMKEMYARKREETLKRIEASIRDMKEYGEPVTKKLIMERAGVSSGTLSKPYVLDLLKKEKVCQFQELTILGSQGARDTLRELSSVAKENSRLKNRIDSQNSLISMLKDQKAKIAEELKAVKDENALLRGQRQLLLERMDNAGIPLGNIEL